MREYPLFTFAQTQVSYDLRLTRINPARSAQTPRRRRIHLGPESDPGYNEGPDARGPVLMHADKVSSRRGRSAHICADQDCVIVLSLFPFVPLSSRFSSPSIRADRFADFSSISLVNPERAIARQKFAQKFAEDS